MLNVDGDSYGRDGDDDDDYDDNDCNGSVLMKEMMLATTSVDGLSLQRLTVGLLSRACTGDHRQRSSAADKKSPPTFILFDFTGLQHLHNMVSLISECCLVLRGCPNLVFIFCPKIQ